MSQTHVKNHIPPSIENNENTNHVYQHRITKMPKPDLF